ncbi:type I-E CRISPR-associated protein Cse2/CasB [Lipingzhangella sp. LS1_29]|uniref:Type I-E CRISPR-associated protein Cse2/CasB n=1 Tax=Lipingzhangella rawalii TaxID=2055835 RepID=A0ABU2H804_9ACTN|nr:type I-E CRISPR-associated protein Cse2/CasB [Lipingzhangella rawalii]MDS1271435.1 type I-E CRISPR-associated protein Cse2/CasB [Lipingzhangella rawalii]
MDEARYTDIRDQVHLSLATGHQPPPNQQVQLPNLAREPLTDNLAVRTAVAAYALAHHGPRTHVPDRPVDVALHRIVADDPRRDIFDDQRLWTAVERFAQFGTAHAHTAIVQLCVLLRTNTVGMDWGLFATDLARAMDSPVGSAFVVYRWTSGYYTRRGNPTMDPGSPGMWTGTDPAR